MVAPAMVRESDIYWAEIVDRINDHEATPFLGAAVSRDVLPDARELAEELADEYERTTKKRYPFKERDDLMKVAQYWAVMVDNPAPKRAVRRIFARREPPDFKGTRTHAMLAELDCPVYLTTNYDDYMERALTAHGRAPVTEICRWTRGLLKRRTSYLVDNEPNVANPVVFHIHGLLSEPETMVLTEDDYLDFTVNSRRGTTSNAAQLVLPPRIDELLTQTSMLFIGYGLKDWNLRVLLRALVENVDRSEEVMGVSVQLEPDDEQVEPDRLEEAVQYLEKYFAKPSLRVFWGKADEFLKELKSQRESALAA
jgi:hypothetical protein